MTTFGVGMLVSGDVQLSPVHLCYVLVAEQVTAHFVDSRVTACTCVQLSGELACFWQQQEEKKSTCDQVVHFSLSLSGAMASSAVSSVLCLRDAAGHRAEMRTGAFLLWRRSKFPRISISHETTHRREN